jgi:hypothetical protein
MSLEDRYENSDLGTLIMIMEKPGDYTPECVMIVAEELKKRAHSIEEVKAIAKAYHHEEFKIIMNQFDPYTDKLEIPRSRFLTLEELTEVLKDVFDQWLEKRESYDFDVWKYAIGGIM